MTIDELPRLLFGPLFVDAIKLHAVIDTPVRPYQVGPVLGHGAYLSGLVGLALPLLPHGAA
jgi:hypothetical protein